MAETTLKASRETVKMKTSEGEVKMAVLGDNPGPEEYLQHLNSFLRTLSRKKWDEEMTKSIRAVQTATASMKKFARILNGETEAQTTRRLSLLEGMKSSRRPKPMNPLRWGWSTTSFERP